MYCNHSQLYLIQYCGFGFTELVVQGNIVQGIAKILNQYFMIQSTGKNIRAELEIQLNMNFQTES